MDTKFKETKIGRIPEEWGVGKIEDVVAKSSTRNPKKKPLEEFKYVDISSVSNVSYSIREHETMPGKDAPSRAQKEIRAQDILYATVRPYLKRIAIVPNHLDGEICSTGFCVVRCKEQSADHRFVFYILQMDWMTNKLTDLQRGSSYPAITDGDVFGQYIPLPPLPEQRNIAEILSTVDETIEKTDAIIEETQQLKKGLMQKLFTEGIGHTRFKETKIGRIKYGIIPVDWDEVELSSICSVTSSKRIMMHEYVDSGIPFYRSKEIIEKMMNISHDKILYISESRFQDIRRKFGAPQNGDILMTAVGSLGIPYLIDDDENFYFKDGNLLWLRDISVEINKRFLIYYFESFGFKKSIEVITAGSSQKALTIEKLEKLRIPLPNSSEQQMITQILSEVDAKIGTEHAFKAELEQLKKGLMQALLTGKVRVKV